MILIIQRDESEQDECDIQTDAAYNVPVEEFNIVKEWALYRVGELTKLGIPVEYKYEDVHLNRNMSNVEQKVFMNWLKEHSIERFIEDKFNVKPLKFDVYTK